MKSLIWTFCLIRNMSSKSFKTLETLNFDNKALKELPLDTIKGNYTRTVRNACFSLVTPTPVKNPSLVAVSHSALELIDISIEETKKDYFVEYFSGNKLIPGSQTASHCYCGHQFGIFAGQLGDGTVIYLGEIINSKGERWEIQLKGSGATPYSRLDDGRKVLRSSIREFLCSEAMYYLGVPTVRAATCIVSEDTVIRDMFYSRNPKHEKCAIVARIAPTFIRFGSFEIFKTLDPLTKRIGPSVGRDDIKKKLLDYNIETFFKTPKFANETNETKKYELFFEEVIDKTALLVAKWQCLGFCHGVLNTDNMNILGLTLDYGPFGFIESFDFHHISNTSDTEGRYTYLKQPEICKWNLIKLAEALDPFIPLARGQAIVENLYEKLYNEYYYSIMKKKLGLLDTYGSNVENILSDKKLIESFFSALELTGGDFTNCFRFLNLLKLPGCEGHKASIEALRNALLSQCITLEEIKFNYMETLNTDEMKIFVNLSEQEAILNESNINTIFPRFQTLIRKLAKFKELKELSAKQKVERDNEIWSKWIESYVNRLRKEVENKTNIEIINEKRIKEMNSHNPRIILRNHIAQNAIEKAEKGDFTEVKRLLNILEKPFDEDLEIDGDKEKAFYLSRPPVSSIVRVSCSS